MVPARMFDQVQRQLVDRGDDHASHALRWFPAGMVEAAKQFRRVNGYLYLPALRAALEAEVARTVTGPCEDHQEVQAA
jgi:hypothetical protein